MPDGLGSLDIGSNSLLEYFQELVAILDVIDEGQLFAEPPPAPDARSRHELGVSMLSLLRRHAAGIHAQLRYLQ